MADRKPQLYTNFNSGEYSPELSGRIDLESFGSSTRFMSNMLSQISGGVKKFYGTTHIAEVTPDAGQSQVKFIPFINKYEPMILVLWGCDPKTDVEEIDAVKVGLIYGDNYKVLTSVTFPTIATVNEVRWKQINDTIIFAHKNVQPFAIRFYGVDGNGNYDFRAEDISFTDIPYFPVGGSNDYNGTFIASGISGTITLSVPSANSLIKTNFPSGLSTNSTYTRSAENWEYNPETCQVLTINSSSISLCRMRNGTESVLCSGNVNQTTVRSTQQKYRTSSHLTFPYYCIVQGVDIITRERVLQVIKGTYPNSYISGNQIVLQPVSDHQAGDSYYIRMNVGGWTYGGRTWYFGPETKTSTAYTPTTYNLSEFHPEELLGRKIKFYFNDDTVISPWWQGKSVNTGDYAYSNGHWYKATNSGTCGNIQPSHTFGTRSDGAVNWYYSHSGSNSATIIEVVNSTTLKAIISSGEIPRNYSNGQYVYNNFAWSIWGKDGVHPSEVYMAGNRLGFICNTNGYGAWNSMSVTDDYYNFSTEEFGEQLDTSAIVHLIANNESGAINWVLSRKNIYMGSYSGEYNVTGANNNSVFTPTSVVVENVSNMGGKPVIPLKYKELNMFVGTTGKELYTIGYDYTIEDYTPHSLGYLTQHIMNKGVRRIEALNNMDRNIYLLHDTNELSLFNYAKEQKVMGFSELNFNAEVLDFCTTYANDVVTGYVATVRNDGKITLERLANENPTYMFDVIETGDGVTETAFIPVTHFANKKVWVRYGDNLSQFVSAELDENGDTTGVPESKKFQVGLPMVAEMHTQPAFGMKMEGVQQQSLSVSLRLNGAGSFDYGCSVDFDKYFPNEVWVNNQNWGDGHTTFTGDITLNIPLGYAENANQGKGPYPNTTGVGINIRSDTPEPFNLLSIQEVYK